MMFNSEPSLRWLFKSCCDLNDLNDPVISKSVWRSSSIAGSVIRRALSLSMNFNDFVGFILIYYFLVWVLCLHIIFLLQI